MEDDELERLEQDLAGVEQRLAATRDWDRIRAHARRASWWRVWRLAWLLAGLAVCFVAGFWTWKGWLVGGAIAFFHLPGRLDEFRERRRALAAGNEELFAFARRELEHRMVGHFVRACLEAILAVVALVVAVFADDTTLWLVVAALLLVDGAIRVFVRFPKASCALREYDPEPEAGA